MVLLTDESLYTGDLLKYKGSVLQVRVDVYLKYNKEKLMLKSTPCMTIFVQNAL